MNLAVVIACAFAAGFGAAWYWRGRPLSQRRENGPGENAPVGGFRPINAPPLPPEWN